MKKGVKDNMRLTARNIRINNVQFKGLYSFQITDNHIDFGIAEADIDKINELTVTYNGKDINLIRNGELNINECDDCKNCIFHKEMVFMPYISSSTREWVEGHHCECNETYSINIDELPQSKCQSEWKMEQKLTYDNVNKKFYRRQQKYITEETIKECLEDIGDAMISSVECDLIDEYGHQRLRLIGIELRKNKYGFEMYHHGEMGNCGWSSKVYIHKRCDMDRLYYKLCSEYGGNIVKKNY